MNTILPRQRGVSLIAAVFLLVLIAGLLAAMVRVVVVQQASSGLDMLGIQAYQAARSGLDWGIYQQLRVQPLVPPVAPPPVLGLQPPVDCFASPQTFALPASGTLRGFKVTVKCTPKATNAVGDTTNRWSISAIACNAPGPLKCPDANPGADYVSRQVQAELN